jgi:hypothetical protein
MLGMQLGTAQGSPTVTPMPTREEVKPIAPEVIVYDLGKEWSSELPEIGTGNGLSSIGAYVDDWMRWRTS